MTAIYLLHIQCFGRGSVTDESKHTKHRVLQRCRGLLKQGIYNGPFHLHNSNEVGAWSGMLNKVGFGMKWSFIVRL